MGRLHSLGYTIKIENTRIIRKIYEKGSISLKKIIPETFKEYQFISEPAISPDGGCTAFIVQHIEMEKNQYEGALYTIENAGGEPVKMSEKDIKRFIWTPDGKLMYSEPAGEKGEEKMAYRTIDPKTGADECAAVLEMMGGLPIFAEDGSWIVPGQVKLNEPNPLYVEIQELPYWGDGRGFTCGKRNALYLADPKTGKASLITPKHFQVMGTDYIDGKLLYLGNEYTGCAEFRKGVYIYDVAEKTTKCVVEPGIFDITHANLLDKDTAIIRGATKEDSAYSEGRFYRVDLKDGTCTKISDYDKKSEFCCIVGDVMLGLGKPNKVFNGKLYFVTVEGENGYIRSIDRDGNLSPRLTKAGVTNFFDINEGGLVFYGYRGNRLGELYFLEEDGTERELTHINDETLSEYHIVDRISIAFHDADGVEIRGWVIPPAGYEPGKKYPAILNIHGGPRGTWGCEFNHEMQVWANAGYFVLFCNPRGSAGRGDDFADLNLGMGGVDYDNFMEFVDQCLNKWPDIDEKRLGVAGGSYGGYMVNWIIGHTDRFAAASSQRSISNWVSMDGLSDMGYYANELQFGGFLDTNAEHLWDISPLKYAHNAVTPTIFLQSEGDYRCPMEQALQMYAVLKRKGVDSKMILFRGESHGLSREGKPQNRLTRMKEILSWLDSHLK